MAEQENFEDDLFADLYDDNDTAAAPAPAAPAAQTPAAAPTHAPAQSNPQPSVETPSQPEINQAPSDVAHTTEENGYDNEYPDETYDDDDDVDFNLGNGSAGAVAVTHSNSQQDDSASTYHSTRGPSAKEDGHSSGIGS
ncbi:hypothetical protein M434DRAFT_16338 [Hypoxylon sp. CO27-5]|nr:hypothetical protein M434DRAFT_16338 [Hypoxylon sp. CO27-5]